MKVIALIGCTASGKDSILKEALKIDRQGFIIPVISTTSRPARENEINGKDYFFIDHNKADEMLKNNEFIECREYIVADGSRWIYGITKNQIDITSDKTYVCIIDLQGLKQLENYLKGIDKEDNLISIFIDAKAQIRLMRALQRESDLTDIQVNEICRRNLDDYKNVIPGKKYCSAVMENNNKNDMYKCAMLINHIARNDDKWIKDIVCMKQ